MHRKTLTPEQAELWLDMSRKLRQASELLSEVEVTLVLKLGITEGNAVERLSAADEALSGLSYMFYPQSEWTGGDSTNPKNFKMVEPHICRS